jgi:hypothetical protein
MKVKKYIIILLILPLLVIGAAYGIVKLLNLGITETTPLYVTVDRHILPPWQQQALATIHLDFEGVKKKNKKVGKANIVLVIDNSGSMGAGKDSRFEIARSVIGNFIDNFSAGQDTKMGVILFDSNVSRQIPLTTQYEELKQKLYSFTPSGGGTNFLPPLELAYQWMEPSIQSNAVENNFIIFLTDGGAEATGPNQFYNEKLLPNSVILFCIGVGEDALYENLLEVLRDKDGNVPPNRVLTCDDPIKLQYVYDQVGEEIGNVIGKQGRMPIPFAHRPFEWKEADTENNPALKAKKGAFLMPPNDQEEVPFLTWPILFARNYSNHIPVEAQTFGIIKPFYDEIPFRYYDIEGKENNLESERIPYILNVSWLLLFLLYLPLILLLLAWLLTRRKKARPQPQPEPLLVLGDREKRPGLLPKQHIHERSKIQWIPTLIIGLGRTGRHVLTHLKQNIDDLLTGDEKTVRLLSIDVAAEEVHGSHPDNVPGTIVALDKETEIYIPDEHLRNVKEVVDQYKDNPAIDIDDPFTTLDLKEYGRLPDSVLGLSGGTQRNAALARAYLVKEMEQDQQSPLLQQLQDTIRQVREDAEESKFMQIIIVGNTNGGTGSGMMTDLAVLTRRIADRQVNKEISVEINLALVDDQTDYGESGAVPVKNRVLLDELDTVSQAGRIYQPYPLVRKNTTDENGILKGLLTRKPHNNVYTFARQTEKPEYDLYPEAADNLYFFIERNARIETRQFIENIRQQEGKIRKNQKQECFNAMTGKTVMYPTRFIKEYQKILFISDIFSDKIALKGLNTGGDMRSIQPMGTVADLYERPTTSRLFAEEINVKKTVWIPILQGKDISPYLDRAVEESEQFIYYLQNAFTALLNEGVYTLTGMEQVIDELQKRCAAALERFLQTQPDTASEIENVIAYLKALKEKTGRWITQLLGDDKTGGLIQEICKVRTRLEETLKELLQMKQCRIILGLDEKTPKNYHFDGLREQWIVWWLNTEDTTRIYDKLKERSNWSIVPQDLLKPEITFEFLGTRRHHFDTGTDLTPKVMEETESIAGQFLVKLKDITIMQLLAEYERAGGSTYAMENFAQQFHQPNRSANLYYIHLFPHHSRIRLNPTEEKYIRRLQEEMEKNKYPYEMFLYPPSSNQYRIFSLQVAYLLKGNYKTPHEPFKPVHMPELLKKENHLTIRKQFDVQCEKEIPYYYHIFNNRKNFTAFARLWQAKKIVQDRHDRLWKLENGGKKYKLTFMESETVMDAALHFVLSDHLPFVAFNASDEQVQIAAHHLKPDKKRQKHLDEEVRDNNTFYSWMKLYLEGGESK